MESFYSHVMSPATVEAPETPALTVRDEGAAYQIERGKPVPGYNHSLVQSNIIEMLRKDRAFRVFSELNLELNGWRSVPDICVFQRGSGLLMEDVAWVQTAPLMAVEIISPTQTMEEMMAKVNRLVAEGVGSVWLVIPALQVVTIFQKGHPPLSASHGTLTDPATGIAVEVSALFA